MTTERANGRQNDPHGEMPSTTLRRLGHLPFVSYGWPGLAIGFAMMAVLPGCDGTSSRPVVTGDAGARAVDSSTIVIDSGRSPDANDIRTPDAQSAPDLGAGRDAGMDLERALDAERADSRIVQDTGPSADVGGAPDAKLTADVGAGPDAKIAADVGGGPDAKTTADVGSPAKDTMGAEDTGPTADPCAGGTTYADSTTAKTSVRDYGWVELLVPTSNSIVEFTTTMVVPEKPAASGTLFLWPGLQPLRGAANFSALDNGVLQPVLTWGPTCAPNAPAQSYKSWWISGQYVNTNIPSSSPNYAAYNDCHGGPGMAVSPGDTLDMRFALDGKNWIQTVTNRKNAQSISYTIDMLGQAQGIAEFVIEEYSSKPLADVIFTSSVITFASPAKTACQPYQRGATDYFTAPRASADGLRCCIDKITLRSQGVAATTPNSP